MVVTGVFDTLTWKSLCVSSSEVDTHRGSLLSV